VEKELVAYIAKALVDEPDKVEVNMTRGEIHHPGVEGVP